jgi:hypothetical protein
VARLQYALRLPAISLDAPLDDANVERFCTLLQNMVHETGTLPGRHGG